MDIRLRPVEPEDQRRLEVIGPDMDGYIGYGGDPSRRPEGGSDWAASIIDRVQAAFWGRIIVADGSFAGEIKLHHHNERDASARLAIGIFRPDLRDRGIGRVAIGRALDAAFGKLALHRVELRVLAKNTRAIRCYEAAGFLHEGRLRASVRIGDRFEDDLVMSILATDPRPARP